MIPNRPLPRKGEDDIGELGEETRKFVQTCELLIRDEMFAKYRWCGNGRPPHSRISMFKAFSSASLSQSGKRLR